jgi:chromosome segregation protein
VRIRQIELVGFKSFRDPTKVTLLPGLNAIVGPNGCGKSNISDAIRWVMGEQSAKHLRAQDMEHLIFGGNEKSEPLNFAEVTLTFEQADEASLGTEGLDGGLAAQVARLAEFTVARRIFRSGESQYLINNQPARLRDITELFMGSGVGPKAYAMIEQGRVGQIVQAKPEDLRLFIEEAAGTTRFRARKIASERKLERTRENLSRVNDVMREIDRQLAALRRQAKRAEQYRAAQQELRETEIGLAIYRVDRLEKDRQVVVADLEALKAEMAELRSELDSQQVEHDRAQEEDRVAKAELEQRFGEVAEKSSVVVRIGERQTATSDRIGGLDDRIEQSMRQSEELEAAARDLSERLAMAEAEKSRTAELVASSEAALQEQEAGLRAAQPTLEQGRREYDDALAALNESRGRVAAASARLAEGNLRLEELRTDHGRLEERAAARRDDVEKARLNLEESTRAHHAARELHDRLEDSRRRATADLRDREDAARVLEQKQGGLREGIVHVRGRLEGLRELERAYAGYAEGIGTLMALDTPPQALLVDVLEIPAGLEPAVAAALGEVLQGAVVAGTPDGARLAEGLRNEGDGRVSLVPMDARPQRRDPAVLPPGAEVLAQSIVALPGYERLRDALLGDVIVAEDLQTALRGWESDGGNYLWVTRSGDVVHPNGVVTGGQAPASAGILERRRVLGELQEKLDGDESSLSEVEQQLGGIRERCAELGDQLGRLDSEAHEATLALVSAEHKHTAAEQELSAARTRETEVQQELTTLADAIGRGETQVSEAAAAEQRASEEIRTGEALVEGAKDRVDAQARIVEEATSRRDGARRALEEARGAMTHAVAECAQRDHEQSLGRTRMVSLDDEREKLRDERAASVSALDGLAAELEAARQELAEREKAVEEVRERGREIQQVLSQSEDRLRTARHAFDSSRDKAGDLDSQRASLAAQVQSLVEQAREQHGVELLERDPVPALAGPVPQGDEALGMVPALAGPEPEGDEERGMVPALRDAATFDAEGASERIAQLRDRLSRLGDVNLAAIADARELEERHEFLLGQRSDLERSMEDLERTIGELSRETRKRFKDTFEKANEKFGEIFVELFRGGGASLKLTNPSNLLESGVELEAQPPGKLIGSLSALSGGERALTAVSLIMALFSLRATPFCVLDEVDAPLDDANVSRYNAMLRRMSDRTQFIIVTHKQRTMESADVLYGVTMPEPGVSQLVSVRMEEAEDRANSVAASA